MLLEEREIVLYLQSFLSLLLQNRNHFELVEEGISIFCLSVSSRTCSFVPWSQDMSRVFSTEILNFGTKLSCKISIWIQGIRVLYNVHNQPCIHIVAHAVSITSVLLIPHLLMNNEY